MTRAAIRREVAASFLRVLHEADEESVLTYELEFFKVDQLEYMEERDRSVVKQHLVAQLAAQPGPKLFEAMSGIGKYVKEEEIKKIVDASIRTYIAKNPKSTGKYVENFLIEIYNNAPNKCGELLIKRLEEWVRHFKTSDRESDSSELTKLIDMITIPF